LTVDQIEARRLARAVRTDQRHDLAGADTERHIAHRPHAVERLRQARDVEKRVRHRRARRDSAPPMPRGNSVTSARIPPPTSARQYWVLRASVSCSQVNAAAPSSGPNSAFKPPSSTMTSASTERGIASVSGEMLPLENANNAPASPAKAPASAKPR